MTDLVYLQSNCRKDPASYEDDFIATELRFNSMISLFEQDPSASNEDLIRLLNFMSHVVPSYPDHVQPFIQTLKLELSQRAEAMDKEVRNGFIAAFKLLGGRGYILPLDSVTTCFGLFHIRDKQMRLEIRGFVISLVRNLNRPSGKARHSQSENVLSGETRRRQNQEIQEFLYSQMRESDQQLSKRAFEVIVELYSRGIWMDERTVNALVTGVDHSDLSIVTATLRFFVEEDRLASRGKSLLLARLHVTDEEFEGELDVNRRTELKEHIKRLEKQVHAARTMGSLSRTKNKIQREAEAAKQKLARMQSVADSLDALATHGKRSAMNDIHDPQALVERLLKRIVGGKRLPWKLRLLYIQFIARLIGHHNLILLDFYDYLQAYLRPGQQDCTNILASVATSVHHFAPPEKIYESVVRPIADNFCFPSMRPEIITVGLNTLRQVFVRQPYVFDEHPELLKEMIALRNLKQTENGVIMSARALLKVARDQRPELLDPKDLGKAAALSLQSGTTASAQAPLGVAYGEETAITRLAGARLLEQAGSEDSTSSSSEIEITDSDFDDLDLDAVLGPESEDDPVKREKKRRRLMAKKGGRQEEGPKAGAARPPPDSEDPDSGSSSSGEWVQESADSSDSDSSEVNDEIPLEQRRILSDEDFRRMERLQSKLQADHATLMGQRRSQGVTEEELLRLVQQEKLDGREPEKQSRRDGRRTFHMGHKDEHGGGLSNAEKRKTKDFRMIVKSKRMVQKEKRSARDKYKAAVTHIRRQKQGIRGKKKPM